MKPFTTSAVFGLLLAGAQARPQYGATSSRYTHTQFYIVVRQFRLWAISGILMMSALIAQGQNLGSVVRAGLVTNSFLFC